jgi:predicted extracellular nuclease
LKTIFISAISVIAIFFAVESAQATSNLPPSCKNIESELGMLRKAQSQIILGLADNHDQVADSLTQIAGDLRFYNKPAPIKVIHNMNGIAAVFRKRGEKARGQAQSLDEATADLSTRIVQCLHK